jgi:prevent-host-death family protein
MRATKTIPSTDAQNNFGQILNDVVQNSTRYVIKRRNQSLAIILSLSDFEQLLLDQGERGKMANMIRELAPIYKLGEEIEPHAGLSEIKEQKHGTLLS